MQSADSQLQQIISELETWASQRPDIPILTAGSRTYTPKQILEEVRNQTHLGKDFVSSYNFLNKKG